MPAGNGRGANWSRSRADRGAAKQGRYRGLRHRPRAAFEPRNAGSVSMKRLLATITILAAFGTMAQAQQLTKVRVAYDGYSMTSGPLIYAEKQGIFKKFGLDISPVFVEAGSTLTGAVIGGSVDIAQNGYTSSVA